MVLSLVSVSQCSPIFEDLMSAVNGIAPGFGSFAPKLLQAVVSGQFNPVLVTCIRIARYRNVPPYVSRQYCFNVPPQNKIKSVFQGVKVGMLGRQIERNSSYVWLAQTSIFGLCFMSVCLMKSNCYSLMYSSLL